MVNQWHNSLANSLSLDVEWTFSLGGQAGTINIPGTWEAQGYPRRIDGPAIHSLQVNVPEAWRGKRVQLQFDAVSYHVEAKVNDVSVGTHTGLWTPFAFDVSHAIRPGVTNSISLI